MYFHTLKFIFSLRSFHTVVVCLLSWRTVSGGNVVSMKFFGRPICDVDQRLAQGCAVQMPHIRNNRIRCISACMKENACVGSSVVKSNGSCFSHYECPVLQASAAACGVSGGDQDHVYTAKQCDNGGAWVPSKGGCQCVDGWVGITCQQHPTSCQDLIANGYPVGQHHVLLDPDGSMTDLYPMACYTDPASGYTNVPVMMNLGNTDYNMTWQQYRDGVYINEPKLETLWIGLRTWHVLSLQGYTDMYAIMDLGATVGRVYRYVRSFHVAGEEDGFSYTNGFNMLGGGILGEWLDFGDCFSRYQNTPFSTWDRDQDWWPGENCAAKRGSGWWFQGCDNVCNLLGWGRDHWHSKPSAQLINVLDFDENNHLHRQFFTSMYIAKPGAR